MNKFVLIVPIFFLLCICHSFAGKGCKEHFQQFFVTMQEICEEGKAPPCFSELELDQFQFGGDPEKMKEMMPKLKEHVKNNKDKLQEMIDCSNLAAEQVLGSMDDMPDECKEKMSKITSMMFKRFASDE